MPVNQRLVEGVLHIGLEIGHAKELLQVRVVFGEEKSATIGLIGRIEMELKNSQRGMIRLDHAGVLLLHAGTYRRLLRHLSPRPRIAKPECRQDMQRRSFRPAIRTRNLDQDVVRPSFRVFNFHVEIAVLRKRLRIGDLKLMLGLGAVAIDLDQFLVGICALRILIKPALVRMGRQRIEKKVGLLHVLAVIALGISQAEHPLL